MLGVEGKLERGRYRFVLERPGNFHHENIESIMIYHLWVVSSPNSALSHVFPGCLLCPTTRVGRHNDRAGKSSSSRVQRWDPCERCAHRYGKGLCFQTNCAEIQSISRVGFKHIYLEIINFMRLHIWTWDYISKIYHITSNLKIIPILQIW